MSTQVFSSYEAFLARKDQDVNGVSKAFAEKYPQYETENETNTACWNCNVCRDCTECVDCNACRDCVYCNSCRSCSGSQDLYARYHALNRV